MIKSYQQPLLYQKQISVISKQSSSRKQLPNKLLTNKKTNDIIRVKKKKLFDNAVGKLDTLTPTNLPVTLW